MSSYQLTSEQNPVCTLEQLTKALAHSCGTTESDARELIDSFSDLLVCILMKGMRVKIPKVGMLYCYSYKERVGYNQAKREKYVVPASTTIGIRPSSTIKAQLKKGRELSDNLEGIKILSKVKDEEGGGIELKKAQVREDLLNYLIEDIQYGVAWVHPITKRTFTAEDIGNAMNLVKAQIPNTYLRLWKDLTMRRQSPKALTSSDKKIIAAALNHILLELIINTPNTQKAPKGFSYE